MAACFRLAHDPIRCRAGVGLKLDKITRRRLYANKESIEFPWPGTSEPKRGHVYAIETENETSDGRFKVLAIQERDGGWTVMAALEQDRVRLLARAGGYTDFEPQALHNGYEPEPEAVDKETQRRFSDMANSDRADSISDLIVALNEVTSAINERIRAHPEAKAVSKELYQAKGRLEDAKRKLQMRAAA